MLSGNKILGVCEEYKLFPQNIVSGQTILDVDVEIYRLEYRVQF